MKEIAFIFDLDGVIVDTTEYHYRSWKNLANQLGFEFTHEHNEHFKGVSREKCLEQLLNLAKVEASQEQFDTWMIEKNIDYLAYIEKMNIAEVLPDVPRILNYLKDKNIPMAVGSASKNARSILAKVNLIHYFDSIVDGTNVANTKPNPEVFLRAAKGLGVSANKCVVFEDAIAGVQAANNAQMISIGIGDAKRLAHADYNFKNFTEIENKFLEKLIR